MFVLFLVEDRHKSPPRLNTHHLLRLLTLQLLNLPYQHLEVLLKMLHHFRIVFSKARVLPLDLSKLVIGEGDVPDLVNLHAIFFQNSRIVFDELDARVLECSELRVGQGELRRRELDVEASSAVQGRWLSHI